MSAVPVMITPRPYRVTLDACIADEVVYLNREGVYTVNSCCGHGKTKPTALISANHGSLDRAFELGYVPRHYDGWVFKITLKSECGCGEVGE